MPALRKARSLRPGARIGIAAPAGPIAAEQLESGEAMLRGMGFEPFRAADVTARSGYLAGSDERRARELVDLVKDPQVDAILCARGGYGCQRFVDRLDPALFRRAAKPLIGYSDITTLLLWQRRLAGLVGFHGPMLERGDGLAPEAQSALAAMLQGAVGEPLRGTGRSGGRATGRLVGGSLKLILGSLGTPWEVDTRGALLLFEEVHEKPYAVDRMLQQLRAAGKLDACVGIALGAMVDCSDARYPRPTIGEVMTDVLSGYDVPIVTELPFGHVDLNLPWALGVRAELDGERGELRFLEAGVTTRRG